MTKVYKIQSEIWVVPFRRGPCMVNPTLRTAWFHILSLLFRVQISDALKYVEKSNAVHRDIAARNVLVDADGKTVKLGDFGMSTFLTSEYYRLLGGNIYRARQKKVIP